MTQPKPSQTASRALTLVDEQHAVAAAQAGQLAALAPVLAAHAKELYATIVLPRTGNATIASDIVRETLAQAVEKIGGFQWQGKSMFPWLRQIAINRIFDLHRHHSRSKKLSDALARDSEVIAAEPLRPDAALFAEQEQAFNRKRIEAALARLHERYRKAIELRFLLDLSREQCASQLEVTPATFDVLLFRAIRAFRKEFGPRDHEEMQHE